MSTRRERLDACVNDPWVFAAVYLRHHVSIDGEMSTPATLHKDAVKWAQDQFNGSVSKPEKRTVWVAPRGMGKSTWLFLILPMWAAAFGHAKFIAAFADSGPQAENHLTTFKHELDTNAKLRADFPTLCVARKRVSGVNEADRHGLYIADSGFVFAARGIDASSLGLKIGADRPDLIILDDIEPEEGSYSAYQMKKRKGTLLDGILPLNIHARVLMAGTVTMAGSIIHQAVKAARGENDTENEWVSTEGFTVRHFLPILTQDDGREVSAWPGKWTLDALLSIRHTRSFAKNYANDPMGADGGYWVPEDFRYGVLDGITRTVLRIDPAVTVKGTSDFTGLAIVSYSAMEKKCVVHHAEAVRLTGDPLRSHVLRLLERNPLVGLIVVEANQGGDLWKDVFHGMPVNVRTQHVSEKKEVRAARALSHYQRGRVYHARKLDALEEQMAAFPLAPNDDLVDAVGAGVCQFLDRKPVQKAGASTVQYA